MRTPLNTQARLNRALRNNYTVTTAWDTFRTFKWFTLAMVTLLPIYPSLSVLGRNLETQVGEYDETTIITAYQGDIKESTSLTVSENGLIRTKDEDTSVPEKSATFIAASPTGTTIEPETSTLKKAQSITFYTVQAGDTLSGISTKYNISIDSITWANDLTAGDPLKQGMTLRIPPVSGVVYTVKRRDTLSDISVRYSVDMKDIVEVNNLSDASALREGKELIIPGAVKKVEVKAPIRATATVKAASKSTSAKLTPAKEEGGLKNKYVIAYSGKGRGFAWGNCTWFVAQHKTVTWRGNANQWMKNAQAVGVKTGSKPVPGAIIQFTGRGYNKYYGHVGIVMEVQENHIVIKDMNYRGLNEVTIRKISKKDSAIDGYIYVD